MKCKYCKKYFEQNPKCQRTQKFCSKKCLTHYFNRRRKKINHKKRRCKACGNWFQPKHKNKLYCNVKCWNRANRHLDRLARKQRAVTYKGGKCQRCGYNNCLAALEFHHRNPKYKKETIGLWDRPTWKRLKRELDKCDLLCANCHREVHV
jgi:hypothetical protein